MLSWSFETRRRRMIVGGSIEPDSHIPVEATQSMYHKGTDNRRASLFPFLSLNHSNRPITYQSLYWSKSTDGLTPAFISNSVSALKNPMFGVNCTSGSVMFSLTISYRCLYAVERFRSWASMPIRNNIALCSALISSNTFTVASI
eukprot:GHVN01070835.1.p1 GENE.GHVN01070835.1~~GHVN01070835.1.p1  ORF type:complete len:145 (+),score=3.59 GHVN01070835.1:446-880(+)